MSLLFDFAPLWKGIVLGLGAAAPIGPVNVEIARRSLRGGFRAGFLLGCGAVTIDVAYLALASLGVATVVVGRPRLMLAVGIIGAGVLAYLGVAALRSAWKHSSLSSAGEAATLPLPRKNYVTGLVMTALNPLTLAFWFAATPSLAADGQRDLPLACAGVAAGALSWVLPFRGPDEPGATTESPPRRGDRRCGGRGDFNRIRALHHLARHRAIPMMSPHCERLWMAGGEAAPPR